MTISRVWASATASVLVLALMKPEIASSNPTGTRSSTPMSSVSGVPQPEVAFDAATGQVTVRVSPRHLEGVRIPFPLRDGLVVLENGVRQSGVDVKVEHSPMTLAVLVEHGSRSHQLTDALRPGVTLLLRPLLEALDAHDRVAIFAYGDSVRPIVDFDTPREQWGQALDRLREPRFSETNFYDATLTVFDRMAHVTGRKAILVLSTGIDTFSRARIDDVLERAEREKIPVYVFNLAELVQRVSSSAWGILARVDWSKCGQQLERLAQVSGGRAYMNASSAEVAAVYDDMIEDLRVRYVVTYRADPQTTSGRRTVQIALVDPTDRQTSWSGTTARRRHETRMIAEGSYTSALVTAVSRVDGGDGPPLLILRA